MVFFLCWQQNFRRNKIVLFMVLIFFLWFLMNFRRYFLVFLEIGSFLFSWGLDVFQLIFFLENLDIGFYFGRFCVKFVQGVQNNVLQVRNENFIFFIFFSFGFKFIEYCQYCVVLVCWINVLEDLFKFFWYGFFQVFYCVFVVFLVD